jgi:hypothetical protein
MFGFVPCSLKKRETERGGRERERQRQREREREKELSLTLTPPELNKK